MPTAFFAASGKAKSSRAWTWTCCNRSEEHTSELQSHRDLHSFPTRRSSDLPVVSTKVWRVNHADGVFRRLGQGKELPGVDLDLLQQRAVDAMSGQVEEAHVPRGMAQCIEKALTLLATALEQGQVQ